MQKNLFANLFAAKLSFRLIIVSSCFQSSI